MKIGYARVSTDDQTLDLQLDALKRVGCRNIYQEHGSGKSATRPQLEECLKALREGDTLFVWRLDRLGRNLASLIHTVTALESNKIGFVSITERIDTASSSGRLVFHVFASLAEFERNLIRERTMAGLTAARARGRKGGRRPSLSPKDIRAVRAFLKTGELTVGEIAQRFNVARSTIYNHLN
ncbi:recombinase family protein [Rhodoferax sp.]|uniref:recombinase family protein n=1 Tax=Rhodoferax sp. TaxID=50421 RepID=UPI0039B95666